MLASANNPLFENLFVDSLSITFMLMSYGMNPCSIMIIQQEETKVIIACANLLRSVDNSLFPLESELELVGQFHDMLENRILYPRCYIPFSIHFYPSSFNIILHLSLIQFIFHYYPSPFTTTYQHSLLPISIHYTNFHHSLLTISIHC